MKSVVKNSNLIAQVVDFTALQNHKIRPSDIDAVLEFDNEVLILMEFKRRGVKIPSGQKFLLERICDSWHTKKSIVLKVEHCFYDENKNIPIEKTAVTGYYMNGSWIYYDSFDNGRNIIDVINKLGVLWNCTKCKF